MKGLLQHPSLHGHGASHSPSGHEMNVARSYALNWDQLDPADEVDAAACQLLVYAACLAPDESIPMAWLKAMAGGANDNLMMTLRAEDGLLRLITMGFLLRESGGTVCCTRC